MRPLVVYCILITFSSCLAKNQVPKSVIEPGKMKTIVFDLLRADEYLNTYLFKDTSLNKKAETVKLYEQVFLIHHVSRDDFYKSYKYYQEHPDVNKLMFDSLNNWINRPQLTDTLKNNKKPQ